MRARRVDPPLDLGYSSPGCRSAGPSLGSEMDSIGSESRSWRPAATPFPQLGACLSCGTPIAEGWRCRICRLALEQALGLPPVGGAP
jgi:hypothetical protein